MMIQKAKILEVQNDMSTRNNCTAAYLKNAEG